MAEIKTNENASETSDQDPTDDVSSVTAMLVTWKNLDSSSLIQWPRLNCNDSHPHVSSEPLIEDETPDRTITPKFIINRDVLLHFNAFLDVFE